MFTGTLIFAGGGTGGHLYPGLAIARAVRDQAPASVRSYFVCSDRSLDSEILGKEGVEFEPLRARPLSLRPRGLVRFLASWGRSVRAARAVIRRAAPGGPGRGGGGVIVVAMGGFVAAPVVQAARAERCPVVLVNLDAVPGKANRWIARHAGRAGRSGGTRSGMVFTTARIVGESPGSRWTLVPPIVRREAMANNPATECRRRLGLDPGLRTLVVTGGSQGARSIDALLTTLVEQQPRAFAGWQVLHQTGRGEGGAEAVRDAYRHAGVAAIVVEFSDVMADWWGAANLAVCRAGAGNVAEVWANRVPALFLPYPFHRDQHQRHNAAVLVEAGGAVVATDLVDPAKNAAAGAGGAGPVLLELMGNPGRLASMSRVLERLGPANGAEQIAESLLGYA